MRLKTALYIGLAATALGLAACGDPNRTTYVQYTPAPNFTSSPSPAPAPAKT